MIDWLLRPPIFPLVMQKFLYRLLINFLILFDGLCLAPIWREFSVA
ncbi:hypothetical protein GCM10027048_06210 [Hymenobacter coalescens]